AHGPIYLELRMGKLYRRRKSAYSRSENSSEAAGTYADGSSGVVHRVQQASVRSADQETAKFLSVLLRPLIFGMLSDLPGNKVICVQNLPRVSLFRKLRFPCKGISHTSRLVPQTFNTHETLQN